MISKWYLLDCYCWLWEPWVRVAIQSNIRNDALFVKLCVESNQNIRIRVLTIQIQSGIHQIAKRYAFHNIKIVSVETSWDFR